nr:hypothetical protein BaRGS_029230 [Batillaria attramentaria]
MLEFGHKRCEQIRLNGSRSTNVSLEICIPLNNEVKISALPADWLQKRNDVPPENVLWNYSASATTQTDDAGESQERPIFASFWQGKKSFSYTGGIFHIENSDVRLEVPAGAVPSATYVDMVGATYTNLAHIRTVLGMSCDEVIMSPAAELHAGTGFRFAKPVHLYLPTALPSAFPEELIKVYHFHEAENGDLTVKLLPSRAAYEKHHEERKNDMNADGVEPRGDTRLDEFSGYFERLPSGELRVTTSSFSGYVCSACRQQVDKMPQIQLLATGSHVQIAEDSWQVDIRLALWDRKINIADFQRDHLQGQTPVAPPQTLNVVDDFQESLVQLQLTVYGPYQARWRHALRPHSHDPVFAVVKDFLLNELLHCQTEDAPRFEEWLIENVPERVPGPVFQCYIDATNTYPEPQEQGATCAERGREKKVTLFVSGVKKTSSEYDEIATGLEVDVKLPARQDVVEIKQTR